MISISNVSQVAYVTADFDRSLALFKASYNVPEFFVMRDVALGDLGTVDVAMAYAGATMIELIAPHADAAPMFRGDQLDFDNAPHEFHHIAVIVDDRAEFDRIKDDARQAGLKIAAEASNEALDFVYIDTVDDLGHYIEYMFLHDVGRSIFAALPRV